jgi:hypothetical protein
MSKKYRKSLRFYSASLTTEIDVATVRIRGREGVRVNPNIVRMVMHIDIFGWSLHSIHILVLHS